MADWRDYVTLDVPADLNEEFSAEQRADFTFDSRLRRQIEQALDEIASTPEGLATLRDAAANSATGRVALLSDPSAYGARIVPSISRNDGGTSLIVLGDGRMTYPTSVPGEAPRDMTLQRVLFHEFTHLALNHPAAMSSDAELRREEDRVVDRTNAFMARYYGETPRDHYFAETPPTGTQRWDFNRDFNAQGYALGRDDFPHELISSRVDVSHFMRIAGRRVTNAGLQAQVIDGDYQFEDYQARRLNRALGEIAATPEGRDLLEAAAAQTPSGEVPVLAVPEDGNWDPALNGQAVGINWGEAARQYYRDADGDRHDMTAQRLMVQELFGLSQGHMTDGLITPQERLATVRFANAYMARYYGEIPQAPDTVVGRGRGILPEIDWNGDFNADPEGPSNIPPVTPAAVVAEDPAPPRAPIPPRRPPGPSSKL